MSYMLNERCYNCLKNKGCTDLKEIQKAIIEIHDTTFEEGHKGAGTIELNCVNRAGETCYSLSFSEALQLMQMGNYLSRKGWNGKGLHVIISRLFTDDDTLIKNPCFLLWNPKNDYNTWMPSITDIFANDWGIVTEEQLKIDKKILE